ncbi:MAG: ECF transporter S component [Sulfolobales archaeon]
MSKGLNNVMNMKNRSKQLNMRYTSVDYSLLGLVAVVAGIIFYATWFVYEFGKIIGGPIVARIISYGLWFIGAPLAATLIRKPFSAFLGETLGALVETLIPTVGGFTNLIYGVAQGFFSEIAYMIFGYRRWGAVNAVLAGALAGIPAVMLDAILFGEIAPPSVMILWLLSAVTSGGLYGFIAYIAVSSIYKR